MPDKILVIDDEKEIVQLLKNRLENSGYQVVAAKDGLEGLERIAKEKPDLILLDNLMPRMTGYEMVQKLRDEAMPAEFRNIPVIVITAKPNMRSLFEGYVEFSLPKPVEAQDLLEGIARILGPRNKKAQGSEPAASGERGTSAVLAGVEPYITGKVRESLESLGFKVHAAVDESHALELAKKTSPTVVVIQFWEEAEKFDSVRIYRELQAGSTASIPVFAYCPDNISVDAMKSLPRQRILPYHESSDLLPKLKDSLKQFKLIP